MGAASIVCGIIGMCFGWLPYACWAGVGLGVAACVLGVPSVTRWYEKPGYGPWGVSGIILGLSAFVLSFAYSVKHASGALDGIVLPLEGMVFALMIVPSSFLVAAGLTLARKRRNRLIAGEVMAFLGVVLIGLGGAWTLTTADRSYEQVRGMSSSDQ